MQIFLVVLMAIYCTVILQEPFCTYGISVSHNTCYLSVLGFGDACSSLVVFQLVLYYLLGFPLEDADRLQSRKR